MKDYWVVKGNGTKSVFQF